jgi:hypothetical protein
VTPAARIEVPPIGMAQIGVARVSGTPLIRALLAAILAFLAPSASAADLTAEDFAFNYDQPAFYTLLERLRTDPVFPPPDVTPAALPDWAAALARPSDFRGQAVTITGVLGRNKDSFRLLQRPDLGELTQLELSAPGQPVTATVICTSDVADLPIGATVELTGYFVMARSYYTAKKRVAHGLVLVSPGPTSVSLPAPPSPAAIPREMWIALAGTLALAGVITVILLRRAGRTTRILPADLHATEPAPFSLADELAKLTPPAENEPEERC